MKILTYTFLAASFLSPVAQASILTYTATLSGLNEVPANTSPATGNATVIIDSILNTMRVEVTFSGLIGTVTASHIHCCTTVPLTGNAGVATVTPTFTGFPSGVTSGTYDNTFDLTVAGTYNPAFITAQGSLANAETALLGGIAAGDTYLNIHSTTYTGGEIRGYLQATPEPATIFTAGLAAIGFTLLRRKRRA